MNQTTTWVLVANCCQAKFYKVVKFPKIEEFHMLEHPESKLRDQELVSSKPGRNFQSGGTTRHSYVPQTDPKRQEAEQFARTVASYLSAEHQKHSFSRLYIVASPSFLGQLRQHLNSQISKTIVAEIDKDMLDHREEEIEQKLVEV